MSINELCELIMLSTVMFDSVIQYTCKMMEGRGRDRERERERERERSNMRRETQELCTVLSSNQSRHTVRWFDQKPF